METCAAVTRSNGTSLSVPANFVGSFVASFVVSQPAEYGEFDKAQNKARDKDMLGVGLKLVPFVTRSPTEIAAVGWGVHECEWP